MSPNPVTLTLTLALALALPHTRTLTPTLTLTQANQSRATEELIGGLTPKHALLFIDTCDHLTTAEGFVELISNILRRAPKVKLLLSHTADH